MKRKFKKHFHKAFKNNMEVTMVEHRIDKTCREERVCDICVIDWTFDWYL